MPSRIHQFDVGTEFIMQIMDGPQPLPLGDATVKILEFLLPDGSVIEKDAELFEISGDDGKLIYTAEEGFLSQVGDWEWQAYVVKPSGKWHSDKDEFTVYPNIGNAEHDHTS